MTGSWLSVFGLGVLLFLSAFFAAAETALTSVSRIKAKQLEEENVSGAKALSSLLEHPSRFLSLILFGNNLANIAASSLATAIAISYFHSLGVGIATGVMLFLILIFGEITPKSFAVQNAEKIALLIARPIAFLVFAFSPLVKFFIVIANVFTRLLGGRTMREGPFVTEEEIKTMVSVGEEEGVIEEEEKEMIHSIFEFGDTIVREVMVPRMDMTCVDTSASVNDVLQQIIKEGHSRIPVFEENKDNIVGVVYAKDLLIRLGSNRKDVSFKSLLRPAYFIPETKKVTELLREFQKRHQHIAIVVDEYGGTAGLVTFEDLLEEIVGEIFDEYDVQKVLIEDLGEGNFRLDGRADLGEVNQRLEIDLPEAEAETIGGFVYSLFGKIPSVGEKVKLANVTFTVEKVEKHRISKILVTKEPLVKESDRETEE